MIQTQAEAQANFCKVFSNSRRVLILFAFADKEMSVGEIARTVGDTLQNTSRHLTLMKDKGILASRRDGQTIFYRVAEQTVLNFCHRLMVPQKHSVSQENQFLSQPK